MIINKNIVVLVGNYYPNYSAVGICAKKIVERLAEFNCVRVVSLSNADAYVDSCLINNHEVFFIDENNYSASKISSFKHKLFRFLGRLLSPLSLQNKRVSLFRDKLNEINDHKQIDVLIPMSFPFETNLAALEFVNEHQMVSLYPCWFDEYKYNTSLHYNEFFQNIKMQSLKRFEKRLIEKSKRLFMLRSVYSKFLVEYGEGFLNANNVISVLPPILNKDKVECISSFKNKTAIKFIYAGAITLKQRSPLFLLETLLELKNELVSRDVSVDFYGIGNGFDLLNRFCTRNTDFFENKGYVTYSEIQRLMDDADFLLSIGDNLGEQISSKIFDYMNLGKPIIHFANNKACETYKLLKNYPMSYSFVKGDDLDVECFLAFLESDFTSLSFSLTDRYPDAFVDFYLKHLGK